MQQNQQQTKRILMATAYLSENQGDEESDITKEKDSHFERGFGPVD